MLKRWRGSLSARLDNVSLLTAIQFLMFMGMGTTGPSLSIYLRELGASFSRISVVLTTSSLVSLGANYTFGRWSDHLGRRKPIVLGALAVLTVGLALLSRARSVEQIWAIMVMDHIAIAAYMTVGLTLIGDWVAQSDNQGRRIGTYRGFGSIAFAVGALASGIVINRLGLQQAYLFASGGYLLATLIGLLVQDLPPQTASEAAAKEATASRFSLRDPMALLFLTGVVLWNVAHSAQTSMFPNFLRSLGMPSEAANWLWGLAALVEGVLMPFIGVLADSFGSLLILASSGLSLALTMAGYVSLRSAAIGPTLIAAQISRGWGFASYTITSMLHATQLGNRKSRGSNVGIYGTAMGAGNIIGLAVGGTLVDWRGFTFLFAVCAVSYFTSSVLFALMRRGAVPTPQVTGQST